jgi:hypothetical protein
VIDGRRIRQLIIHSALLAVTTVAAGCARNPPALPTGASTPFPDFATPFAQATDHCRTVRTFAGVLELSGHVGSSGIPRTRIEAGFADLDQIRLEAKAPFGRSVFVLVARQADEATLVLPRDKRVLSGAPADAIVEALTGVRLGARDLRALVTGCGPGLADAGAARMYEGGWLAVDASDRTFWLRQLAGSWRVVGAVRGGIEVRYDQYQSDRPSIVRLRTTSAASDGGSNLTLRVSDVDINVPLGPEVFQVEIPPDAAPLTLEELRRSGPLGTEGQ